jgi:hypothetical protein
MLRTIAVLLMCSLSASAQTPSSNTSNSQAQRSHTNKPSSPQPESCAFPLIALSNATGSSAYVRLRYLIAALDSAQDSVTGMASALKELDTATNAANALAPLITGADEAKDELHCAAFIMNQYPGTDDEDKIIKTINAAAFNREADAIVDLMALVKEKLLRSAAVSQSSATQVRDAERMSKITESQNKAANDLLQTTLFAVMKAVDLSDKDAKTAPYLAVTCDEYADLIKRNAPFAQADKSAYTQAASLIQTSLDGHKCREQSVQP